jgi:hypothetical protein
MRTRQLTTGPKPRNLPVAVFVRWFVFALASITPLSTGCGPNKRYDLIEAELRTRERELAETRQALEQARNLNRAYVQQSQNAGGAGPVVPNPQNPPFVPMKEIVLGRGTGGVDEDGIPGDEGLMVVVVPRDEDGAAVKVPGGLQIAAWEITPAGMKNPIGHWNVSAEKVRPTWRSGFISTGYFVAVPWQTYPSTEKVRVAVRFTTLDGRAFEADKDIFVKVCSPRPGDSGVPVPTPKREPLFPDPLPPGGNNLPPGVEELPPPSRTSERGARLLPPVKEE